MWRGLWVAVAAAVALAAVGAPAVEASASDCSACQYRARNCSTDAASASGSSLLDADDDGVDVCDASGDIQFDDVFCDEDDCNCAPPRQCVNLVVGCANLFQARSRKRCLGNDTIQLKFERCAASQALTTLSSTNMASDWVFFKQSSLCTSADCNAVRKFHAGGLVQCGNLLAAWKDEDATSNATAAETTAYHFVVDGSRKSDLSSGTFHYTVPYDAATETLLTASAAANSSRIDKCYSIQTRNQKNSTTGTCDGVYLVHDTTTQLADSGNYDIFKLDWYAFGAVVASVAVAVGSIGAVAVVFYRLKRAEHEANAQAGSTGELLGELDELPDRASVAKTHRSSGSSSLESARHQIRQRSRDSDESEEQDAEAL